VVGAAGINVNGRTVNLIVTHLDPESRDRRLTQAKQVTAWAANLAENRILTGDMNAWPDQSSIAEFTSRYRDSWTEATNNGTSAQPSGLPEPGATRNGRIDYIFYSKGSSNLSVLRSQVYDTRDAKGVMPSDHRPVLTTFDVR
jgi:endonuclease/exonuclease/phosphatase family metal-dependent hydrolase